MSSKAEHDETCRLFQRRRRRFRVVVLRDGTAYLDETGRRPPGRYHSCTVADVEAASAREALAVARNRA